MHYHIIVTDAVWISTFFLSLVYAIVLPTPLCTANVLESIYTRCGVVVRLRRSAKTLCERISGRRRCGRLRVIWRARRTFTLLRICSTAAAAATSLWSMATRGCRRRTSRPRRRGRVLAPWCRQRPLWLQQNATFLLSISIPKVTQPWEAELINTKLLIPHMIS